MVEFPQKRLTFWETPPLSVKLSFALGGKVSQKVKWRSGKPLPKLFGAVGIFASGFAFFSKSGRGPRGRFWIPLRGRKWGGARGRFWGRLGFR